MKHLQHHSDFHFDELNKSGCRFLNVLKLLVTAISSWEWWACFVSISSVLQTTAEYYYRFAWPFQKDSILLRLVVNVSQSRLFCVIRFITHLSDLCSFQNGAFLINCVKSYFVPYFERLLSAHHAVCAQITRPRNLCVLGIGLIHVCGEENACGRRWATEFVLFPGLGDNVAKKSRSFKRTFWDNNFWTPFQLL